MLDASQRLNILSLLIELKAKRKLTVLLITHDLASAKLMSDRIMVMYMGKIVEYAPKDTLFSRPHHPYTETILSATPQLRRDPFLTGDDQLGASLEEIGEQSKGCVFMPRCKYSTSVCKEVSPELLEKSPNHFASCHNPLNG
jgi:peptide/nickel transport system ATP-binding protein